MTPEEACSKITDCKNPVERGKLLDALADSLTFSESDDKIILKNSSEISIKHNLSPRSLQNYGICLDRTQILDFLLSLGYSPSRINISVSTSERNYISNFHKPPLQVKRRLIYTYSEIVTMMSISYKKLNQIIKNSISSIGFSNKGDVYLLTNEIIIPDIQNELVAYFQKHPHKIFQLSSRKFEELVAQIFKAAGYEVELTPAVKDGGYDMIAIRHDKFIGANKYLIECKRYAPNNRVGVGVVRGLYGVVSSNNINATKGIITTTSTYTRKAIEFAEMNKHRITLNEFKDLQNWLKYLKI